MILETPRLSLRALTPEDYGNACLILQDAEVMYAWEHAFSDEEAREWFDKQFERYERTGVGFWAVIEKETGAFAGVAGLIRDYRDELEMVVPEVGYLFRPAYWGRGYATEAARGCIAYAFDTLGWPEVYLTIKESNQNSLKVASRLGAVLVRDYVRHYYGKEMTHKLLVVKP